MKRRLDELAVFGGPPAFATPLHVGRPNIGNRERLRERLDDMLDRRWLTNDGPFVHELEERIAQMTGVRYCVAVCNATAGLEVLLRAAGVTGEVIVPSFTFVATVHAVEWMGCTPVFADIEPASYTLDPECVATLITNRTSAIIGAHIWGRPCAIDALEAVARQHEVALFFDAAHAFACSHHGRMIGGFGDAEVFSFHATKFINAFEGGAIVTNDDALAERLRLMRNFGFVDYDQVESAGTNAKMNEASAAMALTSLDSMDDFIAANRANHQAYTVGLRDVRGLQVAMHDERERNNHQYIVAEVDCQETGLTADEMAQILTAENLLARRYFHPGCHRMEPYRSRAPTGGYELPHTERLTDRTLVLPTGTAVDAAVIADVCALLRFVVTHGTEISRRLGVGSTPCR